jgi:glycosyltransferase involved in cell wall biosynthesis
MRLPRGRYGNASSKLLLVTDAWHPQVNGVVTALSKVKEWLERDGWEVVVIHPELFRSVPLPWSPEVRMAVSPWRTLRRLLMREAPGYVHIATEGPLGWSARALCRRYGWRFTSSYHTHFHLYAHVRLRPLLRPVRTLLRVFHDAATCTMAATPSLKRDLEDGGFSNIALWPLGVDVSLFVRRPAAHMPPLPRPVFAVFGRLAPEKSPEEFLSLDLPGTKLVIGDGPRRAWLQSRFGTRAHFVGYRHGQELVDWLSMCDVMVFPSRTDTFGLVILEALACGIPVAAHDVMGPRDIIQHGIDGVLGKDLRAAALACLSLDRSKCREKALRYSWEASAAAFKRNLVHPLGAQERACVWDCAVAISSAVAVCATCSTSSCCSLAMVSLRVSISASRSRACLLATISIALSAAMSSGSSAGSRAIRATIAASRTLQSASRT